MNASKILALVSVSLLVAILLASALNSITRVSDSALAQVSPLPLDGGASVPGSQRSGGQGGGLGRDGSNVPRAAPGKNYLPIIFLNSATAGGAWLLSGNAGTIDGTDFLGTTDKVTLTLRVSNTVAFRFTPTDETANVIGGYGANSVSGSNNHGSTISGGGSPAFGANTIYGGDTSYSTIGGGIDNVISGPVVYNSTIAGGAYNLISGTSALRATIGGGSNNIAGNQYATVGGGYHNTAGGYAAVVGGGDTNTAGGDDAIVGGGIHNTASGFFASIGGGWQNTASNLGATVGGGSYNAAGGYIATVGGGQGNTASNDFATVGGGTGNTASGIGAFIGGGGFDGSTSLANQALGKASTIGGGLGNAILVTGTYATIGGGSGNTASSASATVPGGFQNVASGDSSFAAGNQAQAINRGAFVWGDSTGAAVSSTANDQFIVRAAGGVKMVDGTNVFTPTYAALQVENATPFGEAAWLRLGSDSNPVSVISLIKQISGTGNFLQCFNESAGSFTSKCHIDSTGAFVGGSDFAEALSVVGDKTGYAPGDLVSLSSAATRTVTKARGAYDPMLIGVYSTRPGFIGADKNGTTKVLPNEIPVALTGIVPVKVTLDPSGGAISIGDPLTSSSTPGVAMKAIQAGKIIGYAMQSATNDGIVLALVQPGDYVPPALVGALKQNAQLETRVDQLTRQVTALAQANATQAPDAFTLNNLPLWGVIGLLALFLVRRRK